MFCCSITIQIIRDLLFSILALFIIIYSYKNISNINIIKELEIKTNFIVNNISVVNVIENNILKEENENDKYIDFFNKYGLKEGGKFTNNQNINYSIKRLYGINITNIVLSIILIIPTLAPMILFCVCKQDEEGFMMEFVGMIGIFIMIGRFLLLLILFGIFLGFNISYKNNFENAFFELYNNISDIAEKTQFQNYYQSLFELNNGLLIDTILIPVAAFYSIGFVIFFFDPCGICWKCCIKF